MVESRLGTSTELLLMVTVSAFDSYVPVLRGDPAGPALAREIVREVRDAERPYTGSGQ